MIETECQKLVIKAVEEIGGAGLMLNNRFRAGVADMMVKLPDAPVQIFEAKRTVLSAPNIDALFSEKFQDRRFGLAVTKLQDDFLKEWEYAQVHVGILSFLLPQGGNVSSLCLAAYRTTSNYTDYEGKVSDHRHLGSKEERNENIRDILRQFSHP